MSKYDYYDLPTSSTAATTNRPVRVGSTTAETYTLTPSVLSDHCAVGVHDYGKSDRCDCPCHRGMRPAW